MAEVVPAVKKNKEGIAEVLQAELIILAILPISPREHLNFSTSPLTVASSPCCADDWQAGDDSGGEEDCSCRVPGKVQDQAQGRGAPHDIFATR